MKKNTDNLSYEAAYNELQQIVQALQSESVSIDELSKLVARSTELIRFCREKLRITEEEIAGMNK